MNRFQEIEQFLQYFAMVYSQNPNLEIGRDSIYHSLENYGLTQEEIANPDILYNFGKWIDHFHGSHNLLVYHDIRQKRFLQFHNRKGKEDNKYVKLYLNYSKEDIYEVTNRIFEYIKKKNIQTFSKVADRVRSDSIVLRIGSVEEAKKVMDFVRKDPFISSKAARPTNPFLFRDGNFGIAYDDSLSFNSTVSTIIANYFQMCREMNRFHCVSFNDFKTFVQNSYNNNFRDVNGIRRFCHSREFFAGGGSSSNRDEMTVNFEQVYKMLLLSLDERTTTNDIMHQINNFQDKKGNDQMISYFHSVFNNSSIDRNQKVESNVKTSSSDLTKKSLFDLFIQYNIIKYGPILTRDQLNRYAQGDVNAITRDHDFRESFAEHIEASDIAKIAGPDISSYVSIFGQAAGFEPIDSTKQFDVQKSRNLLNQYIRLNFLNSSPYDIANRLLLYMNGDKSVIPEQMQREFINNLPPGVIIKITGPDMEAYIAAVAQEYGTGQSRFSF